MGGGGGSTGRATFSPNGRENLYHNLYHMCHRMIDVPLKIMERELDGGRDKGTETG